MIIDVERRSRARIGLQAPCTVVARGPGRVVLETENISRTGLLVRWNEQAGPAPRIGGHLSVEIGLPENPVFGKRCLAFRCTVVRVSRASDGHLLVALRSDTGRFRSAARQLQHLRPVNGFLQ